MPLSEALEKALRSMNEEQRDAAVHGTGPMLVLAGPGSGKTFVITNRISYLIEQLRIPPERILVITFTKEAAASMQKRFLASQNRIYPVNFGTFHAIFYQILKRSAPDEAGGILTDSEKKQLIFPILLQLKEKLAARDADCASPGKGKQAGKDGPDDSRLPGKEELYEDSGKYLAAVSYYKNTCQEEKAAQLLPQWCRGEFLTLLRSYEQARRRSGKLDFDDMLFGCLNLLKERKDILEFWQRQFRFILIDEFQDINPLQYEIIRLLAGTEQNLFVVGDDDQSIYGFRGSEPRLMRQFLEDYPRCRQVLLKINYRSRPEIVNASLKVIDENKDRFPKDLKAAKDSLWRPQGKETVLRDWELAEGAAECGCPVVLRSFAEREGQYRYLTERLREEREPENCAVLFRTNAQMQGFASRLARLGIPYSMKEKSSCPYDHFIARDLNHYIQFACGDRRRSLFLTIMNKPSRFISREALLEEEVDFTKLREYYLRYAPPGRQSGMLLELKKLEEGCRQLSLRSPYLGIQYLRKGMGYEAYLKQKAGADAHKLAEWMELLEALTTEAASAPTYEKWFETQQIVRSEMAKSASAKTDRKGIRLMTDHASKGLEFDHVYIPDLNEGTYPHGRFLEEEAVEEERRMLYVAMTRAKETLELIFLTGTDERPGFPSRFLNPLL